MLTGTRDYRLELGKKLGADIIFNTREEESKYCAKDLEEEIKALTEGKMANRVICPTGNLKAMNNALKISGRRATIVYFGLPGPDGLLQIPVILTHLCGIKQSAFPGRHLLPG